MPDSSGGGHEVWIELPVFDRLRWTRAEQAIAADPEVREQLFDGEFPERLDAVFARAGLSLLPARAEDLAAECSCPQWSPNCRHLAAVLGALAAAFDRDPFLLLAWRGRDQGRLLRHVREAYAAAGPPADEAGDGAAAAERPLEDHLSDSWPSGFWQEGDRHRALRAAADHDGPADGGAAAPAALSALGPSGIAIRGRSLESLLRPPTRRCGTTEP
ncbi:hypothetical protein GXW82_16305 [Streptacidiphilus sp. 4-A2]|nr:hypothetical protein [Streptacidiphilus sp. 4-A2]